MVTAVKKVKEAGNPKEMKLNTDIEPNTNICILNINEISIYLIPLLEVSSNLYSMRVNYKNNTILCYDINFSNCYIDDKIVKVNCTLRSNCTVTTGGYIFIESSELLKGEYTFSGTVQITDGNFKDLINMKDFEVPIYMK